MVGGLSRVAVLSNPGNPPLQPLTGELIARRHSEAGKTSKNAPQPPRFRVGR
jgi:hypothetical protein